MRVIVCGSRAYFRDDVVRERVRAMPAGTLVIAGRARGPDTVAEREALRCGLTVDAFPADWQRYGRRAGWVRNGDMLRALLSGAADERRLVIAFWDGASPGTAGMIRLARDAGIEVEIYDRDGIRHE